MLSSMSSFVFGRCAFKESFSKKWNGRINSTYFLPEKSCKMIYGIVWVDC
jgi:hypothetical protein